MKRCHQCRRDYYDETLLYCLDDGNALLDGPASGLSVGDEPATAILSEPGAVATGFQVGKEPRTAILHETAEPNETATRAQIHATEEEPSSSTLP